MTKLGIVSFASVAAALTMAVAACGGEEPKATPARAATATPRPQATPTPAARATAPPAGEPKYGGTLQSGSVGTPVATGNWRYMVNPPEVLNSAWFGPDSAYNNLIVHDVYQASKVLQGVLAESWQASADGSEFTFKLRRGVQWHDGKPFTAKDVAYSYNLWANPPYKNMREASVAWYQQNVVSATATDDFTAVVKLKAPSASFIPRATYYRFTMQPSHLELDSLQTKPVGTGPYKFDSFQRDVSSTWLRNPNYFQKDAKGRQLPFLDGIKWFQFLDTGGINAAFRTGQIQFLNTFQAQPVSVGREVFLKEIPGVWLNLQAGGTFGALLNNRPPWNNPKVREAMDLFVDRKVVRDLGWKGFGSHYLAGMLPFDMQGSWGLPAKEIMSRPGYRYVDKQRNLVDTPEKLAAKGGEMVKHPDDIARARALLKESGVTNVKVTVLVQESAVDTGGPVFVSLMNELFGGGWTFEPQTSFAQFYGAIIQKNFDVAFMPWAGFGVDEPYVTLDPFRSTSGSFWGGWPADANLDRLLDEQERTLDPNKRREIMWALQRAALDFPGRMHHVANGTFSAARPEVGDPPPAATSFSNFFQMERIWLKR